MSFDKFKLVGFGQDGEGLGAGLNNIPELFEVIILNQFACHVGVDGRCASVEAEFAGSYLSFDTEVVDQYGQVALAGVLDH